MSGSGAWAAAAVAAVTGGYALVSRRLASTVVSAPLLFTAAGVLVGPVGFGLLDLERDAGPVLTLAEVALALVLFTDAATIRSEEFRSGWFLPVRLLVVGLPLTIAGGVLLAWALLPGMTGWELALVGVILAPTDASVSKAAVFAPRIPAVVRHGLNAECGLNECLVMPVFAVLLAGLPGTAASHQGVTGVLPRVLVLSPVLGLAVGGLGGWLLCRSRVRGRVTDDWRRILPLALATLAGTLAAATDGSAFVAAWVAGFAFTAAVGAGASPGAAQGGEDDTLESVEHLAALLAALSFLVFGAVLLGPALAHLSWRVVTYAVLSLTVVRMLPTALALTGSRLRPATVAYTGWFGSRGLPSLVLGLLVAAEHVPGTRLMGIVIAVTVGLGVLLHGVSSVVLAGRYGRWYEGAVARRPALREGVADRLPGEHPLPEWKMW
ncbi:cation:proton antiporter domain-containing protein [Streptomyces griseocarneus]|uniref:cation:proton antiporter domain-containing protein n=1 Tax=Streptomyces griseocarneus TaxID=51201 RepID=UPI00167D52EC|nr:cation:proton antiporter [Streptomyces griseocarneus]MBZ6475912.1 cation:proton antiporter [Streptomyces griseocarneus]GHG50058.1 sodium:proton antiporter [Streptomyces griseocarneus]